MLEGIGWRGAFLKVYKQNNSCLSKNRYFCNLFKNKETLLNSFCIHNFKNISDLTIPKLRQVNLVVGKNGVGKSTFLEALSLLFLMETNWTCVTH